MTSTLFKHALLSTTALVGVLILPLNISRAQVAPQANPPAVAPATQPSADEVQTAIDAKQYVVAIKTAQKLLALHGPAAAGLDRFQITMLKGYAQAGSKANSTAVMTFKSAKTETKDPRAVALADWTAELFHTAGSNTFISKSMDTNLHKRGPFDLLNSDQRKQAFSAFLDDNLTTLQPKLKVATVAQNLAQIWPVLEQVIRLDELDLIANGNDDKTTALTSTLLDHSKNLLLTAVKADWTRVSDIDTHANIVTNVPSQTYVNTALITQNTAVKNGLSTSNRDELHNIISVCQKIHDAAEQFMSVSKSDKDWSTIVSDADRVAGRASDVLSADYSATTSGTGGTDLNNSGFGYQTGTVIQSTGVGGAGITTSTTTTNPPPVVPPKKVPPVKGKTGSGS